MGKVNFKKWAQVGIVFGLLASLLGWLTSMLPFKNGIANISFAFADIDVGSALKTGVGSGIGEKIVSILNGIVPIGGTTLGGLIAVAVSGLAVMVAGRYIYEMATFYRAGGKKAKLVAVAIYGSLAVGVVLSFMAGTLASMISLSFVWITLATIIAFLMVAVVYVIANNYLPKIAVIPE